MFEYYTPHLITAASFFLAVYIHARAYSRYWRSCVISALITAVIAPLVIFGMHDNYVQLVAPISLSDRLTVITAVTCLAFGYGFVLALLVGYVVRYSPSFFD